MGRFTRLTIAGGFWIVYMALVCALFTGVCSLIFQGCAATGNAICEDVPDGQVSVLCKVAEDKGISLGDAAKILKLANVAMLESGEYSAADAKRFIKGVIEDLEGVKAGGVSLTYLDVIEYVNGKKRLVSSRVLAAFEIIEPGSLSAEILSLDLCEFDIDLLIKHLNEELTLVKLYL